jgi:hypothetical protein
VLLKIDKGTRIEIQTVPVREPPILAMKKANILIKMHIVSQKLESLRMNRCGQRASGNGIDYSSTEGRHSPDGCWSKWEVTPKDLPSEIVLLS